jgi:hypothetical protein
MLRIKEFRRMGVSPDRLSFLKPDSMLFEVRSILGVISFEPHTVILYANVYTIAIGLLLTVTLRKAQAGHY